MTDTPQRPGADDDYKLAEWVVQTCLLFGASPATAYQIAGLFVRGVRR